jgi:ATP-dependent DNA ligase
MLANKYEPNSATKKKHGLTYPCFVQPKLDGLRCVVYLDKSSQTPVYQSRTGGEFVVLQHLDAALSDIFSRNPDTILDGELYTTEFPFEELAGIIKKKKLAKEDQPKIQRVQYHIYDIVLPGKPYKDRLSILQTVLQEDDLLRTVPTHSILSVEEFKTRFREFVEAGYEGIMLRNEDGLYQENYRSNDLLKYKEFFEAEYPIVDFKEATGRDKGTVIWECETPEGRRFSVRPRGTVEMRRQWFSEAKSFVSKNLTVIYQELSEMGVPRFPVGKAIRDGY